MGRARDGAPGKRGERAAPLSAAVAPGAETALAPRWRVLLLLCVLVVSALPFLPSARQGFVNWDDNLMLENNLAWRGLSEQHFDYMFSTTDMGHYQPLSWLSFAIEHELWGLDPGRMHVVNFVIHAISAVLLLRLATRLIAWRRGLPAGREPASAWIGGCVAALSWSLHPLRVESVAWATERRDVLSTVFLIATVLCWLRTRDGSRGRATWWLAALACYALSLLSKAWGMTLPALLVVLEAYPLRRATSLRALVRSAVATWPFLPLAALCAWKAASAQGSILATVAWDEHGLLNRFAQASWAVAFYVWKSVWPSGLAPLYELEEQFDPWARGYVVAMAFVAAASVALVRLRKRFPAGLAAWVAFLVLVSPVLGFLQSGAQKAADRYTYLACIPFAVLLGAGIARLVERRAPRESGTARALPAAALAAVALALAALGVVAWNQTHIWKDSETLWRRVVEVEPQSYIAHHNLAGVIGPKGRTEEAVALEKRSIELRPGKGNMEARSYLAVLQTSLGRTDEALQTLRDAFFVDPEHAGVRQALEMALARRGERERMLALYEEFLTRRPDHAGARSLYAEKLFLASRAGDAAEQYEAALGLDRNHEPSLIGLARVHIATGRHDEADALLGRAIRLGNYTADALTERGALRVAQGRIPEALMLFEQALAYAPNHPRALALLRQHSAARQ